MPLKKKNLGLLLVCQEWETTSVMEMDDRGIPKSFLKAFTEDSLTCDVNVLPTDSLIEPKKLSPHPSNLNLPSTDDFSNGGFDLKSVNDQSSQQDYTR